MTPQSGLNICALLAFLQDALPTFAARNASAIKVLDEFFNDMGSLETFNAN
jgi:hypothetical protein